MSAVLSTSASWQAGFLAVVPVIKNYAQFQFRTLANERRQDAIQEAITSACISYQSLAAKGKLQVATAATLATFAVKQVRAGRRVGGVQDRAKDVLSSVARRKHGIRVLSYQGTPSGRYAEDSLCAVIADRKASIPDVAAFRVDFSEWLKTLTHRDRRIIAALASRERTSRVAERFSLTAGRISQLRRRYEWSWQRFQRQAVDLSA